MATPALRALIYCRVSKDEGGGRSVAEQEAEGRRTCEVQGWHVERVIIDNSIGASQYSKGTRDGWIVAKKIVADRGADVLVTWASSRAQRDLDAYAELRKLCLDSGVLWSYGGRTYDMADHGDRFSTGLDALIAEREVGETRRNILRAIRSNAAAGRPHGPRLFGYLREYEPNTGRLIGQVPHPTESAIVRRIFEEYIAGTGVRTIAGALNRDGITTARAVRHECSRECSDGRHPGVPLARWNDAQVRRVLVNPAYTALRVHQGEVIGEADWPPLIDRERFDRVQARLKAMRTSQVRHVRNANLLSGVGRCGVCHGKVQRGHDRNHRKTYLCKEKFCTARDLVKLDAYVTEVLLDRLANPDVADMLGNAGPPPEVVAARERVSELRARLDEAFTEFTAGRLSAALMGRVESEMGPQIKSAEAAARRVVIPLDLELPEDGDWDGWWKSKTPEFQREVVGAVIDQVALLPATPGRRGFDPACVRIDWRV